MVSSGTKYPDYLNPFGEDDEGDKTDPGTAKARKNAQDDYPDDLDPFGGDEVSSRCHEAGITVDDYDNSLNPFGEDETNNTNQVEPENNQLEDNDVCNPFADDIEEELRQQDAEEPRPASANEPTNDVSITPSFESLEPPKPLPRTKSLLKKEQAHKKRLLEIQQATIESENQPVHSLQSTTSSTTSSSSNTTTTTTTATTTTATDTSLNLSKVGSFHKRRNKRLAPPVPVNFKRQVNGSLTEIEEELNTIGDKLAIIDKESNVCQTTLNTPPSTNEVVEVDLKTTRSKLIELIKRKSSIVRRQKELMYMRRELKLDQLHSDIEYELRMIGNKQLSTRTQEDEAREKELLKKLVEIIEEKNDIVDNLNKDTSDDSQDVEEAFKRMNLSEHLAEKPDIRSTTMDASKIVTKGGHGDKSGLSKLSKIATLLPKSSTIKIKRKRLFKKNCDSRPVER